jgi:hypothetical protein
MEETVNMTKKEIERLKTLSLVLEGKISQVLAGKKLNLSDRQVRRLLANIKKFGDKSIISKKRGVSSNHSLPKSFKKNALSLINEHYSDFGPKLAGEYLLKNHEIQVSPETLRLWMIEAHLWIPRKQRDKKLHPLRPRRRVFGELIQIDGSHHDWFEGRAKPCTLMVFIDDATSKITSLHFAESESLEAYYQALSKHLHAYGVPLSFYGDRCAVLTPRNPKENKNCTQFQKALKELDCELILAYSPEAKGRVERANRTLQDRLIKELRLKGISSIEEANAVLEEYREKHNQLFSKETNEQANAHRSLEGISLDHILSIREIRTLNKQLIVQFKNTFYQISTQDEKVNLYKKGKIEIRELLDGSKKAYFKGGGVKMTPLSEVESPIMDLKNLAIWEPKKHYAPGVTHPYKHQYYVNKVKEDILRNVV